MKQKRHHRRDRQMAILPKTRPGNFIINFHKREMLPMKDCPDCKSVGILALNGMFGCPDCRHYFK
ncbi:hypothetical protein F4Z98_03305 [Candidatus Poribacteria bacterium]|nr:hypothetical protein [Candidatus Poribacteria bacterium]MYA99390.1 hypothetical protein [Candidatus Poribacteria bacterium]